MLAAFRDLLAWLFGWKSAPVVSRPCGAAAGEVFLTGRRAGQLQCTGSAAGAVFISGPRAGQIDG